VTGAAARASLQSFPFPFAVIWSLMNSSDGLLEAMKFCVFCIENSSEDPDEDHLFMQESGHFSGGILTLDQLIVLRNLRAT
jgi:hypothetical protein